jgi:hypothetical protein
MTNGLFPEYQENVQVDKNGKRVVTPAFIPSDTVEKCWKCGRRRTMLVIHCEHCDAPIKEFSGCPRTDGDDVAKHGANCFCPTCRENSNQNGETNMARSESANVEKDFSKSVHPGSRGRGGGRQFLKGEDLPPGGKIISARVDAFREAPRNMQFSQYLLDVTMNGRGYTIGIKNEDDSKLAAVVDALGPKTKSWPGKQIKMYSDVWKSPTGKKLVVRILGKDGRK